MLQDHAGQLHSRRHIELPEDVTEVEIDRMGGEDKLGRGLSIRKARGHEFRHS